MFVIRPASTSPLFGSSFGSTGPSLALRKSLEKIHVDGDGDGFAVPGDTHDVEPDTSDTRTKSVPTTMRLRQAATTVT